MSEQPRQADVAELLRDLLALVESGALTADGPAAVALVHRLEGAKDVLEEQELRRRPSPFQQRRLAVRAMDDTERDRVLGTAAGQAYMWVEAVILQRQRIVDPAATTVTHMADAALLALAVRNLRRSADLAIAVLHGARRARVRKAAAEFDRSLPQFKDLRDVLDHFDDYALGVGWQPVDFNVFYERGANDRYLLHVGSLSLDTEAAEAAAVALATVIMLADRD
jgi:hypothetical protein